MSDMEVIQKYIYEKESVNSFGDQCTEVFFGNVQIGVVTECDRVGLKWAASCYYSPHTSMQFCETKTNAICQIVGGFLQTVVDRGGV